MHFQHAAEIWREFPQLVPGAIFATGITKDAAVESRIAQLNADADSRLAGRSESELPEVQGWRRVFSAMGLKPTQYRCASESLLRRFKREHALPQLHPLIDLCNAMSLASAVPIAVFDVSKIAEHLEVRHAAGTETFATFSGEVESPAPGEIIFADRANRAHARRWTHRQSGYSAVGDDTRTVLIVAEGVHASAGADVAALVAELSAAVGDLWSTAPVSAILTSASPRFEFPT